jgi:predicted TIM-barrel fold metal-dependent hydrolase
MIIDAHLHLDDKFDGTANGAAQELSRQLTEAGVYRAIVLHLDIQPWSAEVFAEAISMNPILRGFINVNPYSVDCIQKLRAGIETLGYVGLKLHPRLQEFSLDDKRTVRLVKAAGEMNVPVLIDAFPDGTHLMQGFSPLKYALLAQQCPKTKIIWAHMGGHYVLDFMMLAKRLPNVYLDTSYSLLYYQNSSIPGDMVYAMRSMKFDRIFYGSDYPDRPIKDSLKLSQQFLRNQGLKIDEMDKIMGRNARDFFGWQDL